MKKIIVLIAAIILIANYVSAQAFRGESRHLFQLGVKAGLNISNVYDAQGENFVADPKIGFTTGGFVDIHIWRMFGIQPGIIFSQKGYRSSGIFIDSPYKFTRTSNYIDMPLVATFKPISLVTLIAGPQLSFLISQNDSFTSGNLTIDQEQQFKDNNVRRGVLCILGGFDINLDPIVLGARAGFDIQNNNGDGTSTNPRYKNVWYQATIGFRFF
jgi:hypothetical protein